MRIDHVSLTNFGVYRDATFHFPDPVTLVYGDNGTGKSSLAQAIEFALTGRCQGLDGGGRGVGLLFAAGTSSLTVALDVRGLPLGSADKVRTIQRRAQGDRAEVSFFVDGLAGSATAQQAELYTQLGISEDILIALCDARAFLDLKHADAKAAVMKVLRVSADIDGQSYTLEQLDAAYRVAFEDRKSAKAVLASIVVPSKPIEAAPDVAALEQQLQAVRQEESQRVAARAKDDGRRDQLERDLQAADNTLHRLEQALEKTTDLSAAIAKAERDLEALEPTEGAETRLQTHRTKLATADGRLPMLERTLTAIQEHDPKKGCVLDGTIPCKTAASHFAGQVTRLEQEVQNLRADKDAAQEALEAARKLAADRDMAQKRLASLRERNAAREELLRQQQGAIATRTRLHDEIAALPAPAAVDPALEQLRQRITRGEQTIREGRALVEAWKTYEAAKAKRAEHAKKVEALEQKVEQLGPNGVRVQALAAAVSTFEAVINAALERFGYTLAISVDPWAVVVNGRPAVRLSESERLRVGLALQLALAEVSGLNFAVLDGADLLTAKNRALLADLLQVWTGEDATRQVIVTASRDEPPVARIPGVGMYWLETVNGLAKVTNLTAGEMVTA